MSFHVEFAFLAYVVAFSASAVLCAVSLGRAQRLEDPDTRRGLVGLLVTSGTWASAHVGFLVAPGPEIKAIFYMVGLVVGFAAVGAWLYFCSAYSGRTLHRDPRYRRLAAGVFLAVVLVKLTNPLHGWYFSAAFFVEPFPHVAIEHHAAHWLVTGLAYALSAVGYFMLLELFHETNVDTRPVSVLVLVTALPGALSIVGYATPLLIDVTYEPIGVALFAAGAMYVFTGQFQAVTYAGSVDEPLVFLTRDRDVRDFNETAAGLFPDLDAAIGTPLEAVLPDVAGALDGSNDVLEFQFDGETEYYQVTANPFTVGRTRIGEMVLLSDVTEREHHRRELERQNERLEQFASVVSHDLRNPLMVAQARVDELRERLDRDATAAGDDEERDHLDVIADSHDRMETIIEDVLTLARQGKSVDETEPIDLAAIAERCWDSVDSQDATLQVTGELTFEADWDRARQLFENLYRNAIEHGGSDVTITVGPLAAADGFFIEDDGPGIPPDERKSVFESGYSTTTEGTGLGLAIVSEIVDGHGWTIDVVESESGGARFLIEDVTVHE